MRATRAALFAAALAAPAFAGDFVEPGVDKLVILVRADRCDFARLEARLAKAGRAAARDARSRRVALDWPTDPEKNLDMLGRPSSVMAALEVSAGKSDVRRLDRKIRRKLGSVCRADSYLVHERRLMTVPRSWKLGEASPVPKVITTLVRKPGVSRAVFVGEWTQAHAEMSLAWRRARGGDGHYVQNVVVDRLGEGSPELDGIGEIEGAGSPTAGAAEREARMKTAAHAQTFQDMGNSAMFVAREVILKD